MKKITLMLAVLFAMLISAQNISFATQNDPFDGDDEINIVYLGGSITQGTGAKDDSGASAPNLSWVGKMSEYYTEKYHTKIVNNYNVGIGGTGSNLGISRLQRDVLSKNPDLVFVEFVVNDKWYTDEQVERNMESIVLTLQQAPTNPYIVFVYTTEATPAGALTSDSSRHERIAKYYGIKSIDLKQKIVDEGSIDNWYDYLRDGTHPNNEGYEYYYQWIKTEMDKPQSYTRPLLKNEKYSDLSYILYGKFDKMTSKARIVSGNWATTDGYDLANDADDTGSISIDFSGNCFGVMHYLGKAGGRYKISIDGVELKTVDSYNAGVTSQLTTGWIYFELENGQHTAVITKLATPNANSNGNLVRISQVITQDPEKVLQGMYFIDKKENKIANVVNNDMNMAYLELLNNTDSSINATGIAVVYDAEGKLQRVNTITKSIESYSADNLGLGFYLGEGESMKLFVWEGDGLSTMKSFGNNYELN